MCLFVLMALFICLLMRTTLYPFVCMQCLHGAGDNGCVFVSLCGKKLGFLHFFFYLIVFSPFFLGQ